MFDENMTNCSTMTGCKQGLGQDFTCATGGGTVLLSGLYHGGAERVTFGNFQRSATREATGRRAGRDAVRVMILGGPNERGEKVIAAPVADIVVLRGEVLRPARNRTATKGLDGWGGLSSSRSRPLHAAGLREA